MTLINPTNLRPLQDNILIRLAMHENAQSGERQTPGGLFIPKSADDGANAIRGDAVPAVIVAVGPGRWTDTYRDWENGSVHYGDGQWLPMNPALRPGAQVYVDSPDQGDKVFSTQEMQEYRLVREENVVLLVVEGEPTPLGDRIIVAPDREDEETEGGIILPGSVKRKPTEGEVLAVGPGRRLPNSRSDGLYYHTSGHRELAFKEGDRVVYSKFGGSRLMLEGHELVLLREEDVLAVVSRENAA